MKTTEAKYDFLLALQVGESYNFDITPTPAESRRHMPPSLRASYVRISAAIRLLNKRHPKFVFRVHIPKDNNRIAVVTLIKAGNRVSSETDLRSFEEKRRASTEAWKRSKQAEDAPKLAKELAEEEAKAIARRTAGAIKAQMERHQVPKIDPVRLSQLVAAHCHGAHIQCQTEDGNWVCDLAPTWTLATDRYRIKPTIREWYLILARDGGITAAANDISALPHHDETRRVHVREVLPEEEEAA